jgi:hypothetical protein
LIPFPRQQSNAAWLPIAALNEAINASLADPKMTGRLAELGGAPLVLSSAALQNWSSTTSTNGEK